MAKDITDVIRKVKEIRDEEYVHPINDSLLEILPTEKQAKELLDLAKELVGAHLRYKSCKLAEKYKS